MKKAFAIMLVASMAGGCALMESHNGEIDVFAFPVFLRYSGAVWSAGNMGFDHKRSGACSHTDAAYVHGAGQGICVAAFFVERQWNV